MTNISFPALEAKKAELQRIFEEAGTEYDLTKVKSISGTIDEKIAHVRKLNDELEQMNRTLETAVKLKSGDGGYGESGSEPGSGAGGFKAVDPRRPVVLGPERKALDWLKSTGAKTYTEDFRAGYLGAWLKARIGQPDALSEYMAELSPQTKDMLISSNGEVVPSPIAADLIDRLRPVSTVLSSGASIVPMSSNTLLVPRIVSDPTASWLNEGATVTATDGDVDGVTLTARRLTALTKVSQELAEDSDPVTIGRVLNQAMSAAFAVELDRVALRGSGTPPEPAGVRNQTGVNLRDLGANGADATWDTLADLAADVAGANSVPTGFIWSVRTANAVGQSKTTGSGEYLGPAPHIADIPRRATTAVPTNLDKGTTLDTVSEIYCGRWSDLMVGMRVSFELRNLVERFADEGKIGVLGRMRADVQLRHGASFSVAIGVTN